MKYVDAAIAVLQQHDREMTTAEITAVALERGLIAPHGRTPWKSMEARLYTLVLSDRNPGVVKIWQLGLIRTRRGSVRWAWKPKTR